ncbi:MAG: formylglycine-generating enzyme family protein [Oscillatoria sp. SIO1A7]|nr:formylglycine-generating enzyme family protein [Oscillatoria sp. SIO1A7]
MYHAGQGTFKWRPYAPDLSPQLADFIDRLMHHKADDRPKDTGEILQTLARIKSKLYPPPLPPPPVSPPPPPAVQPVPPTVSRNQLAGSIPTVSRNQLAGSIPTVSSNQLAPNRRSFIALASFTAIAAVAGASAWEKLRSGDSGEPQPVAIEPTPEPSSRETPEPSSRETPEPKNKSNTLSTFSFQVVTVNDRGQEIDSERRSAEFFTEDLGNGVMLEMVFIPGGSFMMGSPDGEGRDSERPQHRVTVPDFFMSRYQVTQAQWQAIMGNSPSYFKGENLPVEKVSWYDVKKFCEKLSQKTDRAYRLPSEAEWEYACRAGTTTPFHFGETITSDLANYRGTSTYAKEPKGKYREKTTPVGSFPPNAFGLYDMHGNVWEWCEDTWHGNYQGAPTDGSARVASNSNNNRRLARGCSWDGYPVNCRGASRYGRAPDLRSYALLTSFFTMSNPYTVLI